jgi:hypothetical protein
MEYDVFISYASEDREAAAFPLAAALQLRGFRVWFDAFELLPGDSIRRKVDEGLRSSRFGVVILSRSFFANEWTQRELDALTAREVREHRKIIVPIWHEIGEAEVGKYSPTLAAQLAIRTTRGTEFVADELTRVLSGEGGARVSPSRPASHVVRAFAKGPGVSGIFQWVLESEYGVALALWQPYWARVASRLERLPTKPEDFMRLWRPPHPLLASLFDAFDQQGVAYKDMTPSDFQKTKELPPIRMF